MDKATELLAATLPELRFEDLPTEVVHGGERKLIDTLGCATRDHETRSSFWTLD